MVIDLSPSRVTPLIGVIDQDGGDSDPSGIEPITKTADKLEADPIRESAQEEGARKRRDVAA
jgi:hypothetical protein